MKKSLVIILFITGINSALSQKFLNKSEVDYWPKNGNVSVPASFNRVSSYLYILNKKEFLNIFKGIEYTKEERKILGIKKKDQPDFLQMSIDIKHPQIANNNPFTIPLFLFDFRDKNAASTFFNYNGKILDDIKADELNSNVMGSINVNALISNASVKFWKDVANISANLGKSATSIALGNPAGVADLTNKLTSYLDQGINALDNLSDGSKTEDHSFFVKLVDLEATSGFDEIVTSVRLYQIHWSVSIPEQNLNFFSNIALYGSKPSSFETAVNNSNLPLVLIVETRSRTKINKGNPVFTNDYKEEISDEYDDYPLEEHQMFKEYFRNFNTAFNAYNYVSSFNATVNSSSTDWNSLVNAINYSYQFKTKVKEENTKHASNLYSDEFKIRYEVIKSRYETVEHQVNELFRNNERSIYLEQADGIINALLNPLDLSDQSLTKEELNSQIIVLSNYDNILTKITSDASNFISNASYQKYQELKNSYETKLFSELNISIPSSNEAKIIFYETIITNYPVCSECISESNKKIQNIKNLNQQALAQGYSDLSKAQYDEFNDCRKQIESDIINMKSNIDTTLDDFEQNLALKSMLNLENNLNIWKENIGKETQNTSSTQLGLWTAAILESRKKIKTSFLDLKGKGVVSNEIVCISE